MTKRTERRPIGGTRELLLDEAERHIAEKGLDAITLKNLADAVGIRVPSIYAHFTSREDILKGVADRYVAALGRQFPDDGGDPMTVLLDGLRGLVIYFASHPSHVRLKLRDLETPGGRPELSAAADGEAADNLTGGPLQPFFLRLEMLLDRGAATGQFRPVGAIELYRAAFGATLVSLTWPTQGIFTSSTDSHEISRILAFIEDVVRRFVSP